MTQSMLPVVVSIYVFISFLISIGMYAILRQFFSLEGLAVRVIYLLQSKYINLISVNHVPSNEVNIDNISRYLMSPSISQLVHSQESEFNKTFTPKSANVLARRILVKVFPSLGIELVISMVCTSLLVFKNLIDPPKSF